jgi:tetratricopeptide (TPR) repeat protein
MYHWLQTWFLSIILLLGYQQIEAQYKQYEIGFEKYKEGKYNEAITSFNEYLSKPNRDKNLEAEVYYLRGLSFYKTQQYNYAIEDFEEAILINHPNKGNIFWFLGKCNDSLGFYPDALEAYENAIALLQSNKENLVKLLVDRSHVYLKMNDQLMAYYDLKQAYTIQPGNTEIKKSLDEFDINEIEKLEGVQQIKHKETTVERTKTEPMVTNKDLAELYKDERRFALVIGNALYTKEIGELRNPVNDATDMAAELKHSNFEVNLLINATYGQMRAALLKFKEKLDRADHDNSVALFYFAGHGLRHEDENYLVPVDARVEYEDDIWRYCFPVQRMVLANMEISKSRMNIVILDACRNNPFPSLTRGAGQQGLAEMKKARGSFIAYATAPGSVAIDGMGRNGLYSQEILKAMQKPGLTIEQVFKEVRVNVAKLSGGKQNTWDSSNITGEFYFKF